MDDNSYYKLDVQGIKFWIRTTDENGDSVYVEDRITSDYYLYMQKIKDNKYIDYVTNRVFTIKEEGDYLVIYPSGVKMTKDRLEICNNIISRSMHIIDNDDKMQEYTNISGGIIFDSYFCNILAFTYGLDIVPASFVEQSIDYVKVSFGNEVDKSKKLVQ